jgi:hypothetical protein
MQSSTATCGIGCGATPPPISSGGWLPGGRTRRHAPRLVPRRRGWRRRARASGAKRACLGGSWGRGALVRLIGGAFYRPECRGQGCPEARRLGGPGSVRRSLRARRPRSRAGRVLAWPREAVGRLWRIQGGRHRAGCWEEERGGPGVLSPLLLLFHGLGRGRGGWLDRGTVQKHGYSAGASKHSEPHSNSRFGLILLPVFDKMPART